VLEIRIAIGDRATEAEVYKNLADLHHQTGQSQLARAFCQQALAIALELRIPLAQAGFISQHL